VLVLVRDAQALYDYLLTQGIIVRNRHRVQLCQNCLRITVGTREENDALMEAMCRFLQK
jgi:histidinol-phosphate aminotransferase